MLFYLLPQLAGVAPFLGALNVTRYITFRTAAASLTAFAISMLFGPWLIRTLRDFQIGQIIRQEGPQSHRAKAGTPTMGGLLILTAAVVPTLLWAATCRTDGVTEFGESHCLRGGLGQFQAMYLLPMALAHAGRLGKYGA